MFLICSNRYSPHAPATLTSWRPHMLKGIIDEFPRDRFYFACFAETNETITSPPVYDVIEDNECAKYSLVGYGGIVLKVAPFLPNDVANIGYELDDQLWGKGLGTEICGSFLHFAFVHVSRTCV